MQMIRWMCGVSMIDRKTEELRKLVGVEPITTVIRRGRLSEMAWTCDEER